MDVLNFNNVVCIVLANMNHYLDYRDFQSLQLAKKANVKIIPERRRLISINWRPLLEPRLNYKDQKAIDPHRVDMATALAIRAGLDPGRIVRTMNGEYTGCWRNSKQILAAAKPHLTNDDYDHIERILTQGCPKKLFYYEQASTKKEAFEGGNRKSYTENPDIVRATTNKEERFSHLLPLHPWCCQLGPSLRHNPQGLVLKKGKDPRPVWDGSTMLTPMDIVLNEITSKEDEAEITFGHAKKKFYRDIFNIRASHPEASILLGLADVKACFRFPRMYPDLTGAFGLMSAGLYCLATAMVFGSNTSASS